MNTYTLAQEFSDHCYSRGLRPKTLEFYKWGTTKLVKCCPTMPTDAVQVNVVFDDPALGRRSRENLERAIRAFLAWAEERHGCPNPLRGVKRMPKTRTLPRVLKASEVSELWRACATPREKAMIALLLDTGIRLGELTGIRWEDVGPDCLRVDGKTGPRIIPVTPEVREMLKGLGGAAHIWVSGSGKGPLSRSAVQMTIRRIFQRAGLNGPKMGPHILRHTFATQYISSGGSLPHLQKLLGHTSITTTEIYLHLTAEALRADQRDAQSSTLRAGGQAQLYVIDGNAVRALLRLYFRTLRLRDFKQIQQCSRA